MSITKQVIVIRKDLNMRKGKMIAQGAHASWKALLDISFSDRINNQHCICIPTNDITESWFEDKFTKITVYVNSEHELLELVHKARQAKLLVGLVKDAGLTEFGGVPTYTAVAIGPDLSERIDVITGNLPLL